MARKGFLRCIAAVLMATGVPASATMCGTQNYPFPFTDVGGVSDTFCRGILESFVLGITQGTTATTFSPNAHVPRLQMTTFLQRTFDQGQKRSSRRAALEQWWIPRTPAAMQAIAVGGNPGFCAADGEHVWVSTGTQIVQVQASTGKILGTWTGFAQARRLVVAAGKVFGVDQVQGFCASSTRLRRQAWRPWLQAISATTPSVWPSTARSSGIFKAADLSVIANIPVGASPGGACSDGINFWVTLGSSGTLLRI